ncbi:hypothetical protein [Nonomuraea sp. B1E8]|uniref:hypothetical protein n=1 Tax=unclassified Nonomuraea TaxID=2593643 RepID=UPI00325DA231
MDSHGSASPASPALGATCRPVGPDTVTGCRPAVEIPEFRDVKQLPDGSWRAIHESGETVTAPDLRHLVYVDAPRERIGRLAVRMNTPDRRGGDDRSQASAVASPCDRVARQRRHVPSLAATGRAAAFKRPAWTWAHSAKPSFRTGDSA